MQAATLLSPKLVELGRALFVEPRLSADGTMSCASCHQPAKAFSDGLATARGVHGRTGTRNTPSLLNVSFNRTLFWDGRGEALASHAMDAVFNPMELGMESFEQARRAVTDIPALSLLFFEAFEKSLDSATREDMSNALSAYLESLVSGNSVFDRFFFGHHVGEMPASAVRGLELFRGRAGCVRCHTMDENSALFSDQQFHSVGVGHAQVERRLPELVARVQALDSERLGHAALSSAEIGALGRFLVTKKPADIGKFRTPSLRNVALTAPYMHDGSVATLEEAVELEMGYRGLSDGSRATLTADERNDLVEFLKALTSSTNAQ